MSDFTRFIAENWPLSSAFIVVIVIYLIYEFFELKRQRFSIGTQDAIRLVNREKGLFLDTRTGKAFNRGHIVGAVNSTLQHLKSGRKFLNKYQNAPIIIYSDKAADASTVCQFLKTKAFTKVFTLKGGFNAWQADKLPIDKAEDLAKPPLKSHKKTAKTPESGNSE